MSKRSIFLRSEADKCLLLAKAISDAFTQEKLRDLAAEYFQRATDIESKEKAVYGRPSSKQFENCGSAMAIDSIALHNPPPPKGIKTAAGLELKGGAAHTRSIASGTAVIAASSGASATATVRPLRR